jgi:hypothetical protein
MQNLAKILCYFSYLSIAAHSKLSYATQGNAMQTHAKNFFCLLPSLVMRSIAEYRFAYLTTSFARHSPASPRVAECSYAKILRSLVLAKRSSAPLTLAYTTQAKTFLLFLCFATYCDA